MDFVKVLNNLMLFEMKFGLGSNNLGIFSQFCIALPSAVLSGAETI